MDALSKEASLERYQEYVELQTAYDGTKTGQDVLKKNIEIATSAGDSKEASVLRLRAERARAIFMEKKEAYRLDALKHADFLRKYESAYNASDHAARVQLAEQGGMTETKALFDLEGNYIHARQVNVADRFSGKDEPVWVVVDPDIPYGRARDWFRPSKANNPTTAAKNNAKKGYYIGKIRVPGRVEVVQTTIAGGVLYGIVPAVDLALLDEPEVVENGSMEAVSAS